jgi:cell division protein ZapE
MQAELRDRYRRMIETGALKPDPAQALAVEKLQLLTNRLASYKRPKRTDFFTAFTRRRGEIPDGLYMFGGVGRGKTMLMDLFFDSVPVTTKKRVHFHAFMAGIHEQADALRKAGDAEPFPSLAKQIVRDTTLLCFDEFHVTDIADAMILGRLFQALFSAGVVVVATSNLPPRELYRDGLNRSLFLPFIAMLEDRMEVFQLEAAGDYRLEKLSGETLYFTPLGLAADAGMDRLWGRLTGEDPGRPFEIRLLGRSLHVPRAAMGAARFSFADLFEKPLGANDYLALTQQFHTLFIDHAPVMTAQQRNEARRFITFVDTLYDNRTGLIMSAAAEPDALYGSGDGAELFQRTASRLMEMRSPSYVALGRVNRSVTAFPG